MKGSIDFINQRIVIDCSVLVKAFIDEGDRKLLRELLELHKKQQLALISSPLIVFELLNVLSKTLKDPKMVAKCFKTFKAFKLISLEWPDDYIVEGFIKSCMEKQISYYDSSYHALAKDMDGIFLTADKKYYEATKNEGNIALYA